MCTLCLTIKIFELLQCQFCVPDTNREELETCGFISDLVQMASGKSHFSLLISYEIIETKLKS